MTKEIVKDLCSDIIGGLGYTTISIMPLIEAATSLIKLLGSVGGLVLLFVSIQYKRALLKEKQREKKKDDDK